MSNRILTTLSVTAGLLLTAALASACDPKVDPGCNAPLPVTRPAAVQPHEPPDPHSGPVPVSGMRFCDPKHDPSCD